MKCLEPQHMLGLRVVSKKGLDAYAYELFKPINDGVVSKAIVAQHLAEELKTDKEGYKRLIEADECLKYIVEAINHVTK